MAGHVVVVICCKRKDDERGTAEQTSRPIWWYRYSRHRVYILDHRRSALHFRRWIKLEVGDVARALRSGQSLELVLYSGKDNFESVLYIRRNRK